MAGPAIPDRSFSSSTEPFVDIVKALLDLKLRFSKLVLGTRTTAPTLKAWHAAKITVPPVSFGTLLARTYSNQV
jgi:hypothetical protein